MCKDGAREAGGGMKRLRKQTGKCRQAAALGSATVQVGRSLRSGAAVSGLREDWRVRRWLRGAKVKVLAIGEAGMLRLSSPAKLLSARREGSRPVTSGYLGIPRPRG